jgi:hypothetical protein
VACGGKNHVDVDILGDAAMMNPTGGGQTCGACDNGRICLLNQCVASCGTDHDCANGERCLRTSAGNGCIRSGQSDCGGCSFGGTVCTDNQCRTACTFGCASDQLCRGIACFGTDTLHDDRGGAGGGTGAGGSGIGGSTGNACNQISDVCSHCGCTACPSDWQACTNDPGCLAIGDCMRRTNCRNSCYQPSACQGVIDSNGGPSGASLTRAMSLGACSMGPCQSSCNPNPAPPAAGWWHFDEGTGTVTMDVSGNGHAGTLVNGPQWKPGIAGFSVAFDGFTQYVGLSPGPILGSASNFTVEAWVNWSGMPGLGAIYSEAGGIDVIDLYLDNGTPVLLLSTGGPNMLRASRPVPTFSWHHVAAVLQAGPGASLYIDGQMVASAPMNAPNPTASEAAIGRSPSGGGTRYFSGALDEVRVFTSARTSLDIQNDYNAMGR